MGIRIHRVMGYGLTDVKVEDYMVVDNRFNAELFNDMYEDGGLYDFDGYREHILSTHEAYKKAKEDPTVDTADLYLVLAALNEEQGWLTDRDYTNVLTWDPEYGLDNVMCFTPPSQARDWYKYDDTVDYYLEGVLRDKDFINQTTVNDGFSWCQVLDVPFYPHHGYISTETGKRADHNIEQLAYAYRNAEENVRKEQNKVHDANMEAIEAAYITMQTILDRLGCEKHWTEKYTAVIPNDLIEYIRYNKIFVDESTIWQLRPMIYTYWG